MNRLNRNKRFIHKPTLKRKNPETLKKLAIAFAIVIVSCTLYLRFLQPNTLEAKQRVQLESYQHQLIETKKSLEQTKSQSKAEDDAKLKQIEQLNKAIQEKDAQLQAKAATKKVLAAAISQPAKTYPVPENEAKAYIYSHESGNNPAAVNSIGCRGLGQACPGTKLPCGADYACQDAYFTNYMIQRYGTWNNAKAFWVANHWW